MGGSIIPLDRAVYCANPDAVYECIKMCPAAEVVSIGVRVGTYLQCGAYFILVLFAPDEGGVRAASYLSLFYPEPRLILILLNPGRVDGKWFRKESQKFQN